MGIKERNNARKLCPICGKQGKISREYPRTRTKDWRCFLCGAIF